MEKRHASSQVHSSGGGRDNGGTGAQNTTQKVYVKDIILSVDNNELKRRCKHQPGVSLEVSEQENVEIDTYKGISDVSPAGFALIA